VWFWKANFLLGGHGRQAAANPFKAQPAENLSSAKEEKVKERERKRP